MLNDIYSLFFNYKNNKIDNSKFEIKFCHAYSLNDFYSKNYSHEINSEINMNESNKNMSINEFNSCSAIKFSLNFNIIDKLTIDINNNLFDLLADLIKENNNNNEKKILIIFLCLLLYIKF